MVTILTKPAKDIYPELANIYAYEWDDRSDAFYPSPEVGQPSSFSTSDRRLRHISGKPRVLIMTNVPWTTLPDLSDYACDVLLNLDVPDVEGRYDLILFICPQLVRDVLETLKVLKAKYPYVPAMVLAGQASGESVLEAFLCGAEDCLVGNVEEDVLREKVARLLGNRNPGGPSHARIHRVVALIHKEYRRKLSLDEMAEVACMSRRHFSRTFRKVIGVPPSEYLNRVRIDHAKRMLKQGRSIAEVALEVGFRSVSHFCRTFKRFEGTSPGAYSRNS